MYKLKQTNKNTIKKFPTAKLKQNTYESRSQLFYVVESYLIQTEKEMLCNSIGHSTVERNKAKRNG